MNALIEVIDDRLPTLSSQCPLFWEAFCTSCDQVEPPYGAAWYGDLFRRHATDPSWLAGLLVINAEKEADGARQLWRFAGRIEDKGIQDRVKRHAVDEARHARFYIAMLNLAFPGAVSSEFLPRLRSIAPNFTESDTPPKSTAATRSAILDEIIQMNIGEVRTLINQMLFRPVLEAIAPSEAGEKVLKLIDALGDDEARHISYTAEVIEELGQAEETLSVMTLRLREFAEITHREVGVSDGQKPTFD
jgi:hypothetical protein